MSQHNDKWCNKYNDYVLPDESGKCSLCGATLSELIPFNQENMNAQTGDSQEMISIVIDMLLDTNPRLMTPMQVSVNIEYAIEKLRELLTNNRERI